MSILLKCPWCNARHSTVRDSRSHDDGKTIYRRRLCNKCGKRWSTTEVRSNKEIKVLCKQINEMKIAAIYLTSRLDRAYDIIRHHEDEELRS